MKTHKFTLEKKRNIFFKFINNYLLGKDKRYKEKLEIVSALDDDAFMIHRLYFSLQYKPSIMKYLNEFMNDLYSPIKYTFKQYLTSFRFIAKVNNIQSTNECRLLETRL
jgi:hypothetical protein